MTNRISQTLRFAAALLALPLLLWTAGCDSTGDDPPPPPAEVGFAVAAYDTSGNTITVTEQRGDGDEPSGIRYADISGSEAEAVNDVTWSSDYTYVLNDKVWVNDGQALTIEPGTVIKGGPGEGEDASALVVAQGGQLFADGTADAPIIFTAEADNVSNPSDLSPTDRGLWGGVVVLGNASLNSSPGRSAVEGIPSSVSRGQYGADANGNTDDADNSGVLRYISIRHGGAAIDPNNEINGLTLAGVGSGTTVEYVEVLANLDDCVEWFGGTVNTRYLVGAYCGDDTFDIDEGWRGDNQFWFGIQAEETANRAGEHDGGTDPEDGQPYTTPTVYNATLIGAGEHSGNDDNDLAFYLRDNFAGSYYNSVFTDFAAKGIEIEDLASGEDSRTRFEDGTLQVEDNFWHMIGGHETFEGLIQLTTDDDGNFIDESFRGQLADYLRDHGNVIADPQLQNVARTVDGTLDPRPAPGSPAAAGAPAPSGGFFESTDYYGAFDPSGDNWAADWAFIFGN